MILFPPLRVSATAEPLLYNAEALRRTPNTNPESASELGKPHVATSVGYVAGTRSKIAQFFCPKEELSRGNALFALQSGGLDAWCGSELPPLFGVKYPWAEVFYDFAFCFLPRRVLFPAHRWIAFFLPSTCNCFSMPFASRYFCIGATDPSGWDCRIILVPGFGAWGNRKWSGSLRFCNSR